MITRSSLMMAVSLGILVLAGCAHVVEVGTTAAHQAGVITKQEKDSKEKQERLDPMIIGFNVTDMYAADHIKRVLTTFPGVFTGIGEFSIHKEFVSAKISGDVASLTDPALDRIFEFCAETVCLF